MREKEEEKEGKAKKEKGARERGGNPGKGKKEGGGKTFCVVPINAKRGVQGRSPWPLGCPPGASRPPFHSVKKGGAGGRRGGQDARKK